MEANTAEADFRCGCTIRRSDGNTRLRKGVVITVVLCCGCKLEANAKRQTEAQTCAVHSDSQLDAVHMYSAVEGECDSDGEEISGDEDDGYPDREQDSNRDADYEPDYIAPIYHPTDNSFDSIPTPHPTPFKAAGGGEEPPRRATFKKTK
jgi:hypothetical protein